MPGTYYGFQVQSTIQNPDNVSTLLFVMTSIFKKRKALITKIDFVCVRGKIDAADDWIIYAWDVSEYVLESGSSEFFC